MAAVVRNTKTAISICFIICLLTTGIAGSAQQGAINLQKKVVIPANRIKLDSLLRLIKKQTGAKFSINTRKFPASKYIRIKEHTLTISGVLQEIKQNTGVYYAVLGDHIILLDNPPPAKQKQNNIPSAQVPLVQTKPSPPQKRSLPGNKSTTAKKVVTSNPKVKQPVKNQPHLADKATMPANNPAPIVNTPPPIVAVDSGSSQQLASDILKPAPDTMAIQDTVTTQPPVNKHTTISTSQTTTSNKSKKEKQPFTSDLFVKAGITVDDLFYCNPTIQLGMPYVYGIVSWSSNFNISGFRYGVGGSIPLSDQWKLHLQVTTGNLSTNFDTTRQRFEFKTRLHRAALIGEFKVNSRFTIQFGPAFNIMKLTFYSDGEKRAPGFSTDFIDKKFKLLKPFYTISDTYSINVAQSTKTWVGFQVGIFFNINFFQPK